MNTSLRALPMTAPSTSRLDDVARQALFDLPSPGFTRWTAGRKQAVLRAIEVGVLTLDGACQRYRLTAPEIAEWQARWQRNGTAALKVTKLQLYRRRERDHALSAEVAAAEANGAMPGSTAA